MIEGMLVRRVTHSVMNDLAVIRLLLDSVHGADLTPEAAENLARASAKVADVADTLGQLSSLARQGEGLVEVDLREVVGRVDRLLDVVAGPAATVQSAMPPEPVLAEVDVREAQHELLADVVELGRDATPGCTITVAVAAGGITVATEGVA